MLKQRIIPKFLIEDGRLIKYRQFHNSPREAGNPVSTAKVYDSYGVDELMLLDINSDRSEDHGVGRLIGIIDKMCEEIFMPVTVGGGVRTLDDITALLRAGADKVAINTAAVDDPTFISAAANRFGSQCIVVSIDYREQDESRTVWTASGTRNAGREPLEWAREAVSRGAGEIVLTSISRDGMACGYDHELLERAVRDLRVPVVASSGAGSLEHCRQALASGVSAITISSLFFFSDHSPIKVRSYLKGQGFSVRASSSSRN